MVRLFFVSAVIMNLKQTIRRLLLFYIEPITHETPYRKGLKTVFLLLAIPLVALLVMMVVFGVSLADAIAAIVAVFGAALAMPLLPRMLGRSLLWLGVAFAIVMATTIALKCADSCYVKTSLSAYLEGESHVRMPILARFFATSNAKGFSDVMIDEMVFFQKSKERLSGLQDAPSSERTKDLMTLKEAVSNHYQKMEERFDSTGFGRPQTTIAVKKLKKADQALILAIDKALGAVE